MLYSKSVFFSTFILIALPVINSRASRLLLAAPTSIRRSTRLLLVTVLISLPLNISFIYSLVKSVNSSVNKMLDSLTAFSYSSLPCKKVITSRAKAL